MKSNWSENICFQATQFHEPESVAELQQVVSDASQVHVVGAGHSFNDICDTAGSLISLRKLNKVVEIDAADSTVTAEGGILFYELAQGLEPSGFALHNLPSLPHFSAVGACATATHGSGDTNQCLAAAVRGLEIVTYDGELVEVPADELPAIAVGLGAFGVVARVKLAVQPAYMMAQEIHLELPREAAIEHLDEILGSAYSVSYFTDWQHQHIEQIWRKHRLETATGPIPESIEDYFGARRAELRMTPSGIDQREYCTEQHLVPGPWHDRLPHVRCVAEVARGGQLQTEYFVARRHGPDALRALTGLEEVFAPVVHSGVMAEVRSVAADDLWISPFAEDSLALHFSWVTDVPAVEKVLPVLEAALAPFEPRPHWGKLHSIRAERLRGLYPRFDDFAALAKRYDPKGKFRNRYLNELFG